MNVLAWFTSRLAGPVLAGVSGLLLVALITTGSVSYFRIADRDATIVELRSSITAPVTGWSARLGQCQANERTISAGFDQMAASIKDLGKHSDALAAAAKKAADTAAAGSRDARAYADRVLTLPRPAPENACTAAAKLLKGVAP